MVTRIVLPWWLAMCILVVMLTDQMLLVLHLALRLMQQSRFGLLCQTALPFQAFRLLLSTFTLLIQLHRFAGLLLQLCQTKNNELLMIIKKRRKNKEQTSLHVTLLSFSRLFLYHFESLHQLLFFFFNLLFLLLSLLSLFTLILQHGPETNRQMY